MSTTKARLWGPLVRVSHWAAALAMLVAVLTAGRPLDLHARAGYVLVAYVVVRVLWAAFGPERARLWSAIGGPAAMVDEIRDVLARKPAASDRSGPVGALLTVALLAVLSVTAITGIATQAMREGEGLLAPVLGGFYTPPHQPQLRQDIAPTDPEVGGTTIVSRTDRVTATTPNGDHPDMRSGGDLKSVHGQVSQLTVWLAVLYAFWTIFAAAMRREHLLMAAVTGQRRTAPPLPPSLPSVVKAMPAPPRPEGESAAAGRAAGAEDRRAAKKEKFAAIRAERQAARAAARAEKQKDADGGAQAQNAH